MAKLVFLLVLLVLATTGLSPTMGSSTASRKLLEAMYSEEGGNINARRSLEFSGKYCAVGAYCWIGSTCGLITGQKCGPCVNKFSNDPCILVCLDC